MRTTNAASSLKKIRFFTFSSFGDLKAIAGAADSLKIAGILRVRLDFFTNAADIDVNRARSYVGSVTPDGIEQMIARKNASRVAREIVEQAEFGGGGGNRGAAHGEDHGRGIDFYFTNLHGTGRERAFEAAKHGFDAGHEFARTEGFSDVVVRSDFEAENAVGFAAFRSKKNHGHRREAGSLAHGAAEFEAVFAGDHDVEDKQSRTLPLGVAENIGAGGINAHREAVVFEVMADEAGNVGIVFNDEDVGFHGIIVAGKQWPVASCQRPESEGDVNFIGL